MTLQRMDNIGITVDDLEAVIAFFTELGLELEGGALIEGPWAARLVGCSRYVRATPARTCGNAVTSG